MKKTLLVLLWLLLSLILPACAPLVTYEELSAEAELTGDKTKLEKFEDRADKAAIHFEHKAICEQNRNTAWHCSHGTPVKERRKNRPPKSIEVTVRDYRKEKFARCGCVSREALRDAFDRARRGW